MSGRGGSAGFTPDRARRNLAAGILVFRWAFLLLMAALVVHAGRGHFRSLPVAYAIVGGAVLWTMWLTVNVGSEGPAAVWFDLAVGVALIVVSGLVVEEGGVAGPGPFFATSYPASAALLWGTEWGPGRGLVAGGILGVALVFARPLNGIALDEIDAGQVAAIVNGTVYYLAAGGGAGVVSRQLKRSAAQLRQATRETLRARERAARLAEREALGRAIHDSVLQALALVSKQAWELSDQPTVRGEDVRHLAATAAQQEAALRALVLREPEEGPSGTASLRIALERMAGQVRSMPVTVSAVGPIFIPATHVECLEAAVRQALDNVVEHAQASRVAVFAETEDGFVVVSVRDDGLGFEYDEDKLRRAGKAGMLRSMKGRVEEMGGRMRVHTAPRAGTEVEFRVPLPSHERYRQ